MIYYKIKNFAEGSSGYQYGSADLAMPTGGIEVPEEEYNQVNAKKEKLSKLQSFYSSDKALECTLKNATNSITKTKEWFCINLAPSMEIKTDQKTKITITIPNDKYFAILNLLSQFHAKVFDVNEDLQNRINLATKVSDINAINIEAEFAKVNKIIIVA